MMLILSHKATVSINNTCTHTPTYQHQAPTWLHIVIFDNNCYFAVGYRTGQHSWCFRLGGDKLGFMCVGVCTPKFVPACLLFSIQHTSCLIPVVCNCCNH